MPPAGGVPGGGERRTALAGARLAGVVAGHWGRRDRRRGTVGAAATLLETLGPGDGVRGWVATDAATPAARALGQALVWAERNQVTDLHVVVDPAADPATPGVLARQSADLVDPPAIWALDGTALVAATPAPVPPLRPAPAPPDLVDLLARAGTEVVAEGGIVRGEVDGLEVARIVSGHTTAGEPIASPRLEVGVGKADRELAAMVHGGLPPVDQLARVVAIVRHHRRAGAPPHPLNQLVPERWLRAVLCRAPHLVGLRALHPAEGARPRPNLRERDIAVAAGEAADGRPAVVACAVGVDPGSVPAAGDARAAVDASRRPGAPPSALVLAVPARDDHPVLHRLAARLRSPAAVIPVPGDWRRAG